MKKILNSKKNLTFQYIHLLIILALSSALYINTLQNDFVYDDIPQVLNNHLIRDIRNIPQIFLSSAWSFQNKWATNYYRPTMNTIYTIDYYLFGFKSWGYHLTNILFNTANSLILYFLTFSLLNIFKKKNQTTQSINDDGQTDVWRFGNISFFTSLLFASHPIHTEVVAWVSAIPELSFTFFYLLSFLCYINADRSKKSNYILAIIFFCFSLLSKETAITLPALLFAFDICLKKRLSFSETFSYSFLKRYFPFVVSSILYLLLRYYAIGGFSPSNRHTDLNAYQYVINVFPLFIQYMKALLMPFNLNVFHKFSPLFSLLGFNGMLTFLLTIIYLLLLYFFRKRDISVFFCLLWILITLLPVLYIPALGKNVFAERYLYLPSIGFMILSALMLDWLSKFGSKKFTEFVIVIILLSFYSAQTIKRNSVWRNEIVLWEDTVEKSPGALAVQYNLATAYYNAGMPDKAIGHFKMAIKISPGSYESHSNLGLSYYGKRLFNQAIEHYLLALQINPRASNVHNNLGIVYFQQKRIDKSIEHYQIALELNPSYEEARGNLANAYSLKKLIGF